MAKGQKTGGRSKGTPNKRSEFARDLAKRLGVDPLEILLRFAAGDWKGLGYEDSTRVESAGMGVTITVDVISPELRKSAAREACKYLYPQLKSVEHKSDDPNAPMKIVFVEKGGNGK